MKSNFTGQSSKANHKDRSTKEIKLSLSYGSKFDNMMGRSDEETYSGMSLYSKQKIGARTHCDQCGKSAVAYEERFLNMYKS